jgi:cysteinyl-tRNA synthetase
VNLQLSNTLTRRKEPFVPRDEGRVGMYLCGPTVYGETHIGNLRNVVVFDVLRRHLVASGYEVLYVRNLTDVDDKIIAAAGHDPLRAFVVAERWARVYEEVTAALGALPPDIVPRASGHIPEMLALIARLLDHGLAYQAGGDVFFAVGKWPDYGKLSGRDVAELRSGARVEVNPEKRDPLDFVLWKGAKPGEPTWDSPWGPGRPGWHIECSAMAAKYLGTGFDIHGGGEDLVFPHHENEIAQSEGATGDPFARYWLHNAFLEVKGEKMAKSVGNVVSPRELLRRYRGVVLRYALLGAHYRSPLEFSNEALDDAAASYQRLATFAVNAARALPPADEDPARAPGPAGTGHPAPPRSPAGGLALVGEGGWRERFLAALDDDLNVPAALAVLFDLVADTNPLIGKAERGDAAASYQRLATFAVNAARALPPAEEDPAPAPGPAGTGHPAPPRAPAGGLALVGEGGWRERFLAALDDDLNVPAALAVLFDLVADTNPLIGKAERGDAAAAGKLRERLALFGDLAARLGFMPLLDLPDQAAFPAVLDLVLDLRERARAARDFAAADMVRERLAAAGIRVEDRVGGPRWHLGR